LTESTSDHDTNISVQRASYDKRTPELVKRNDQEGEFGMSSDVRNVRVFSQDLDLIFEQPLAHHGQVNRLQLRSSFLRQAFDTISPRHAWIEVSTSDCIYSVDLLAPPQGRERGQVLVRKKDAQDGDQRPGQLEHEVRKPKGSSMQKVAAEILKRANYFALHPKLLPEYDEMGPNSNGFVMFLVVGSGGEVDLPLNAYYSKVVHPYFDNIGDAACDGLLLAQNYRQP